MSFSALETNSRNRPGQIIAEVTTGNAHLTGTFLAKSRWTPKPEKSELVPKHPVKPFPRSSASTAAVKLQI
jgi:hypothetical protein